MKEKRNQKIRNCSGDDGKRKAYQNVAYLKSLNPLQQRKLSVENQHATRETQDEVRTEEGMEITVMNGQNTVRIRCAERDEWCKGEQGCGGTADKKEDCRESEG